MPPSGRKSLAAFAAIGITLGAAAEPARNVAEPASPDLLPSRVHVFEDYETDIEKRWWLRGIPETNTVPVALSASLPNHRACRAAETKDFDDKMGDATKNYKAVVFNPVPGPPMGANTRLRFRYWLQGTDILRVQIYSLSNGYHRFLSLTNLPQRTWREITVDLTRARRPDGSGGPLAQDERIDDIQFYIDAAAELIIDDIVLYEAPAREEREPFPSRIIFTGWFDTGKQGAEWRGDFAIVPHTAPLTWKSAKSTVNPKTAQPWIRLHLRGYRPLSALNRLRFHYRLTNSGNVRVVLANSQSGAEWEQTVTDRKSGSWEQATLDFKIPEGRALADELRFEAPKGAELFIDDVLLFEPTLPRQ